MPAPTPARPPIPRMVKKKVMTAQSGQDPAAAEQQSSGHGADAGTDSRQPSAGKHHGERKNKIKHGKRPLNRPLGQAGQLSEGLDIYTPGIGGAQAHLHEHSRNKDQISHNLPLQVGRPLARGQHHSFIAPFHSQLRQLVRRNMAQDLVAVGQPLESGFFLFTDFTIFRQY